VVNPIFLSRKDLVRTVGLSYPTILKLEREGEFPKAKQLTNCRVAWSYLEVLDWAKSRPNSSDHF
jgi:prophage regulatory protein